MTLNELLAVVDTTRPNTFSKELKTSWLNEIEFKVYDEVVNRSVVPPLVFSPYEYERDRNRPLIIEAQHTDVYTTYLYCKIDYTLGEVERYNNDLTLHNGAWDDFGAWFIRTHMPGQPWKPKHCGGNFPTPEYESLMSQMAAAAQALTDAESQLVNLSGEAESSAADALAAANRAAVSATAAESAISSLSGYVDDASSYANQAGVYAASAQNSEISASSLASAAASAAQNALTSSYQAQTAAQSATSTLVSISASVAAAESSANSAASAASTAANSAVEASLQADRAEAAAQLLESIVDGDSTSY